MDLARFDFEHNSASFVRMEGLLKTKTDWRDERMSRPSVVFALTVSQSDFDA